MLSEARNWLWVGAIVVAIAAVVIAGLFFAFTGGARCMPLDDAELDRAYAVFEEWGPVRLAPARERLGRAFPSRSADEIDASLGQMAAVSKTVWNIAELGAESKLGQQKVIEMLQAKHPFLRDAGLAKAVFLSNYYAWHEGYSS